MIPSQYPPKQARSSYVQKVRFGRLMKRNSGVLPLWESLNEARGKGKELAISHSDCKVLPGTRASFVVLLIEAADFNINTPIKTTVFHASGIY